MKCPNCGAEGTVKEGVCSSCGRELWSQPDLKGPDYIGIGIAVVLAIALVGTGLLVASSGVAPTSYGPEDVLEEFEDRINEGNIEGAMDLTVMHFLMGDEMGEFIMEMMEEMMEEFGAGSSTQVNIKVNSITYSGELPEGKYSENIALLEQWLNQDIDDYCEVIYTMTMHEDGKPHTETGKMLMVEINSRWYLAF